MDIKEKPIAIAQAITDLQDADPNELGLVVAYLVYLEKNRKWPDNELLKNIAKIKNLKVPHEEYIALYQRNGHGTWLKTSKAAQEWAKKTLGK